MPWRGRNGQAPAPATGHLNLPLIRYSQGHARPIWANPEPSESHPLPKPAMHGVGPRHEAFPWEFCTQQPLKPKNSQLHLSKGREFLVGDQPALPGKAGT